MLCTGCVPGDLDAPPTFKAMICTICYKARPHFSSPPSLHQSLQSTVVSSELQWKNSIHLNIISNFSVVYIYLRRGLPQASDRCASALAQGINLRWVTWDKGSRVSFVEQLDQAAPRKDTCVALATAGHIVEALAS
jgi:hypothetical protein